MHKIALNTPDTRGVFLFQDHNILRASLLLQANCCKVSTRAWLLFLERRGWIDSAAEIERAALNAGRLLSRLRFSLYAGSVTATLLFVGPYTG